MNDYLKTQKRKHLNMKIKLIIYQITLLLVFLGLWEVLAHFEIINSFLFSKPSSIFKLLFKYIKTNELSQHILISVYETVLGIVIGSVLGVFFAFVLWYFETLTNILKPFLNVLNALPKTALAPIMIIWAGTGVRGIVVVSISILLIITILSTYNYFTNVDPEKLKMMQSFKATKIQIFLKYIFPSNLVNIISVVKINIGMSWVGVIVGEFLVSKNGIGYLIMYGGQVFRLDLVMMGVMVLAVLAYFMYEIINLLEKYLMKRRK